MSEIYIWQFTEKYRVFEGVEKEGNHYLDYSELVSFKGIWTSPQLVSVDETGRKTKLGDFPSTTSFSHLVSENAKSSIGDALEQYGELLPVDIIDDDVNQQFYLYRCTNVIDCLNIERSNIKYSVVNPEEVATIREPVFNLKKIPKKSIFIVPQNMGGDVYVSGDFKEEVKKYKLKGMVLIKKYFDDDKPWVS